VKNSPTLVLALIGFMTLGAGSGSKTPPETATVQELRNETWLFEVLHYVFDWYVDERDIPAVAKSGQVVFWVRELKPKLDEGDHSRFGEVVLRQFTDYHIDRHVVITLDEVGVSNEFMTRNEAGRALFNCVVLGKKVEVQFGAPGAAPR
jgi:hypothetical protein